MSRAVYEHSAMSTTKGYSVRTGTRWAAERETSGLSASERTVTQLMMRALGAVGLAAIALIHLLDAPGKLSETPYMFYMYLGLIASTLLCAAGLIRSGSRLLWTAAATLAVMPFIGYVLTRTSGLPGATGDIGNWTEPLGLASLFVEGCVMALALASLRLDAES